MKKILFASMLLFLSNLSFSQQQISIDSINAYVGKEVKICAKYFGMKETEKVTLINVGAAWPQSPLTVVINDKDRNHFKASVTKFKKEQTVICATGIVSEYKGKLQIVIEKVEQLDVIIE